MKDPKTPSLPLLMALGSIVVHADEYTSEHGVGIDKISIRSVLDNNKEVQEWIKSMGALLPLKRNP